jgi:hypothetical protein
MDFLSYTNNAVKHKQHGGHDFDEGSKWLQSWGGSLIGFSNGGSGLQNALGLEVIGNYT